MKTFLIILSVLSGILAGDFSQNSLSVDTQDSILNANENKGRYRLKYENEQRIFRHLKTADWFVIDTMRQTRRKIGDPSANNLQPLAVRDPLMSPNGKYIAFANGNNIYIHKCDFGTEVAVTKSEDKDIISGTADWLYEEEFATTSLMAWSPDSKQLAYIVLDEHEVPTFTWDEYLSPSPSSQPSSSPQPSSSASPSQPSSSPRLSAYNPHSQYTKCKTLRYPKAGCANAKASVWVYDVATKGNVAISTHSSTTSRQTEDEYIPRLRWTEKGQLILLKLNRDQTKMEVYSVNAKSTVRHLIYKEESQQYPIDYSLFDQWLWLTDGRIIVLSEKDGWRRAYLYSEQGIELYPITPQNIDVTALYAVNEKTQTLFFQAAPTPSERHIYSCKWNDKKREANCTQLTNEKGTHSARFSKDGSKAIFCYQSFDQPNRYQAVGFKSSALSYPLSDIKEITEVNQANEEVRMAWTANNIPEPQLLRIPNANGQLLEAMLLMPLTPNPVTGNPSPVTPNPVTGNPSPVTGNPSPVTPNPLVVMHYSGPVSQRVLNRWRKRFEYALVEAGYAVLIVDPRGGDCRGREWRNETYMSLGIKEAQDLIAAAQWAAQRTDIDGNNMALMGWSYGGYQTLFTMSQPGHPFKAGIAIAPVTDWRLYDSAYTERYMRRPMVNENGYNEASLLDKATNLTGQLLIIHGTGDDNVHVQHTMQYIDALVQANKQFEMQLYPDDNHHLRQGNNALHMHTRILNFLHKELNASH